MGVRARRWQLWLITTFILTGIIGMIQLFKGPESAEAVTIVGGAANSSVALPTRSAVEQATQLPAWTPTDDATVKVPADNASPEKTSVPKVGAATTRPAVVVTSRTQATQLPSVTVTTVQTTAATKATSVVAKTVTASATPTTAKPTTTTPVATTTKAGTTKAGTTTSGTTVKPTRTPVRTTAAAPTPARTQQPTTRCFRILWWVRCR